MVQSISYSPFNAIPKAIKAIASENIHTVFVGVVIINDTENIDQNAVSPIIDILFSGFELLTTPINLIAPKTTNTRAIKLLSKISSIIWYN